jgi:hypothetical protein
MSIGNRHTKSGEAAALWRPGSAVAAWKASYPYALRLRTGDSVSVLSRESKWPGWLWCAKWNAGEAWVPEALLDISGDTAVALGDYDSTELDVSMGEALLVGRRQSGWVWCRNGRGCEGWLPESCVAEQNA